MELFNTFWTILKSLFIFIIEIAKPLIKLILDLEDLQDKMIACALGIPLIAFVFLKTIINCANLF
ncbi:MAG: hypothetical protein IJX78_08060 [Bacilli bacterium]|nr:hypothetical protein [Bacilli bacterium]